MVDLSLLSLMKYLPFRGYWYNLVVIRSEEFLVVRVFISLENYLLWLLVVFPVRDSISIVKGSFFAEND